MAKRPIRNNKQRLQINKIQNGRKTNIVKKRVFTKPQVQDARQKLIQKKLSTVKDARDVLAKIAKGQDARNKLNKLRQKRGTIATANGNIKVIGQNIVQKIDSNGKISLVTNKAKSSTGMNATIQKELGLVTSPKKAVVRRALAASRVPQTVRQAVLNEIDPYNQMLMRTYDPSLYKWSKPGMRTTASQLIGSLEGRVRGAKGEVFQGWQNFPINKSPLGYIDLDAVDDEEMPLAPIAPIKQTITLQGSSRISNIHSRLDGSPIEPETHGIFGQPKTKVVVPAGHRIVVSNLQPTVTQDDVKELFEDIGQLLAARLVRPGVAEVIYKNLKDAQKAVDTYHNRQLDGQPMKCLLVNKRPLNNPTAPALTKMESQGLLNTIEVSSSSNSNKLVPDLSTIHKVLFQRK
ncbi:polymerase delta-interacting protein 3-like isoform X2 [Tribolium madens]|uniref:polymerase delta-interacting protein 3-like isoform X2 n=1 Tax=Tribolium madens TaxID=41895 RepID=UPI001CF72EBD|nr:polymerase delta-interacting protein 3-like isoform X2 [Tribolium madens]